VSLEAAPRSGGRLRIALPRDDDSLATLVRGAEFDTLTEIAPNGALKGELAIRWSADPEGRNWLFDLREGVRFHDGTPLHAQDVSRALYGTLNIADMIEAEGPLQVRVVLRDAQPDLPFLVASQEFGIAREKTVGTGCYRTERLVSNRHYLGRKVQDHFKSGQAGWVDTVEAVVIPDVKVRAEALRDGYVDIAAFPQADMLCELDDLIFHPSAEHIALAVHKRVGMPGTIGPGPMDDGRLAERWWIS
jgi:peptide/nickel transport system substrate-binding protein